MSKDKLIPELRFPEFKNEGEWGEKRISQLGDTINGLTGKSGDDFGNGRPFVTYKQVFDNSIIDFEKCGKVQISSNENQNTLQKGDILFTTSSETPNEVGFASVLVDEPKESTYLNSFCFSLRPFNIEEIKPEFSRYLFHSPAYRKSVTTIAQGSTRYNISKGAFLNLRVFVPKPQEQQKIASCLSSLDELIAAHNDKLDALKDHKKGLLQNLFPQEGETVPKVRFPEFEDDGEWVENELGKICDVRDGTHDSPKYVSDGYPLITSKNLFENGAMDFENVSYLTQEDYDKINQRSKVDVGDILFGMIGTIGNPVIVKRDGFAIKNVALIKTKGLLEQEYLIQLLKSNYIDIQFQKANAGGILKFIALGMIRKLIIPTPKKEEQQKIASCLSAVDELITAQQGKIEQLQQHKKGLMQGLFPTVSDR